MGAKSRKAILAASRNPDVHFIRLPRGRAEAPDALSSAEIDEGRKLGLRVLVRGHWRNQVASKKVRDEEGRLRWGDERRLIFVPPFFKGPEDAEASMPLHRTS